MRISWLSINVATQEYDLPHGTNPIFNKASITIPLHKSKNLYDPS